MEQQLSRSATTPRSRTHKNIEITLTTINYNIFILPVAGVLRFFAYSLINESLIKFMVNKMSSSITITNYARS